MGTAIISADSHTIEPHDLWQQRIEPQFRDRAPKLVHDADTDRLEFAEAELPPVGLLAGCARADDEIRLEGRWDEDVFPGGYDPKARRQDLERDGVVGEVLFPTISMQLYRVEDAEFRLALFRAYNTWLAEFVATDPETFRGVGMLSEENVDAAVAELYRCKEIGLTSVMLPQVPGSETASYADEGFGPLWSAAVECGFPVNFHAATTREEKKAWNAGTSTDGVLGSSFDVQRVLVDMMLGGVFDKFPELQIVSVENEAGWAANMIARADFVWRRNRKLKRKSTIACDHEPSKYLRENVHITFMRDRAAVMTEELVGSDVFMWGNDFPHHVSTWPSSKKVLSELFEGEPDDVRARIVGGNAAKLYHFNL